MLRLITLVALLNLGLLAVAMPRHGGLGPDWLALEALVLAGLFALLPQRRWARLPACLVGALLAGVALLALFDAIVHLAVNRPLNLALDWPHVASLYHLIVGNLSLPIAILATLVLALVTIAIAWGLTRVFMRLSGEQPWAVRGLALALLAVGVAGLIAGAERTPPLGVAAPAQTLVADQIHSARQTRAELQAFEHFLAESEDAVAPLDDLAETDVILGLIESYGVSALFDERYAPEVVPVVEAMERAVAGQDLHMVSGTLNAPMFGGQSWLAHATLLSGLRIESHRHYEKLLASDWNSLVREFNATGHHTTTLMAANVREWPEGAWYGYDSYYDAEGLDYAGPPFHWVTMPDQYIWHFFEQEVRAPADEPIFAKIPLVSSHAPWTPILPVIEDWDRIGDGSLFHEWADKGKTPQEVWRSPQRIREHFARSVASAVEVAAGYAERYVDDDTLLILLGDHQPARIVIGTDASPAVPVHIISGDPDRLAPFRAHGFIEGAMPQDQATDNDMSDLRAWLHRAFGSGRPRDGQD